MSGRGKREKVLRTDAARWRDKVCADIASAAGCAAMSEHRISAQLVNDVVNAVVGYIAAGEDRVANYRRNSRRRRAAEYLAARGHVEILAGDLIRPAAFAVTNWSGGRPAFA